MAQAEILINQDTHSEHVLRLLDCFESAHQCNIFFVKLVPLCCIMLTVWVSKAPFVSGHVADETSEREIFSRSSALRVD